MDIDFENKCKKVFGCSSKHLLYKLTEMEQRISKVEDFICKNGDAIAGTILRVEAVTETIANVFHKENFRKLVDKETDEMFVNNKSFLIENKNGRI